MVLKENNNNKDSVNLKDLNTNINIKKNKKKEEYNLKLKKLQELQEIKKNKKKEEYDLKLKKLQELKELQEIKKNKIINSIRPVYFTLSELSENKRKEFQMILKQKFLSFKNLYKNLQITTERIVNFPTKNFIFNNIFNKRLNIYYLYRNIPNKLFLKKFSNILMIHGKRSVAMRLLLKFFEILKLKFKMSDPISFLKFFIFKNLVPVIKSKIVGFKKKKVIGISLSIYKRIGMTLKLFIKGAQLYNHPIILGLLIEFLKLMKKNSYLQITNQKTISDIKTFKLYKFLQIQPNNLLPEQKLLTSFFFKKKRLMFIKSFKNFSLLKLMKVDWLNFDKIIEKLNIQNNINKFTRQNLILKAIKNSIVEKYIKVNQQFYYFKKELKFYLHEYVLKFLTENDFKNFFEDQNPNNLDLDFDFKRFKDNNIISNIFKKFFVWRYRPKFFNENENNKISNEMSNFTNFNDFVVSKINFNLDA